MIEEITFEYDGRTYHWSGGLGGIFTSYERGVKPGDVRMIDGRLFYVYSVYAETFSRKPQVNWTMQDVKVEQIRLLRKEWFT